MDLKEKLQKTNEYDNLINHTKGYMFDSPIYRFKDY